MLVTNLKNCLPNIFPFPAYERSDSPVPSLKDVCDAVLYYDLMNSVSYKSQFSNVLYHMNKTVNYLVDMVGIEFLTVYTWLCSLYTYIHVS